MEMVAIWPGATTADDLSPGLSYGRRWVPELLEDGLHLQISSRRREGHRLHEPRGLPRARGFVDQVALLRGQPEGGADPASIGSSCWFGRSAIGAASEGGRHGLDEAFAAFTDLTRIFFRQPRWCSSLPVLPRQA
jgi:hypothetical protein